MEWLDPSCDCIGGLPTTGQFRRRLKSDAGPPPSAPYCTCAVLSLHQELAFCSTFNGRLRWAGAGLGSMTISCAVCSLQRAACSVCVRDRHRCLHEYALTSCNRMASTSLQQPLGPASLPAMQETGDKQEITCASSCSCPYAACCDVVPSVPAPVFPGARAAQ